MSQKDYRQYIADNHEYIELLLQDNECIISNSHLVLTSGKHSDGYINLRKFAGRTNANLELGSCLGGLIQCLIPKWSHQQIILIGPETMGRTFLHEAAYNSSTDEQEILYAWCEPNTDKTAMQWNPKLEFADMVKGKTCIIIDDVLTTAKTLTQTIDLIRSSDAEVGGAVVVVQRNPDITAESLGIPWLTALYSINLNSYEPNECPLCKKRIPMLLHPGHGYTWIKNHPEYPTTDS